jgi:hypothetical protein
MAYAPSPELRECFLAAKAGDPDAARVVFKLYGYPDLVKEVKGKLFSNKARRAVDCLTAGYGTEWEVQRADGLLENMVATPPPPGTPPRSSSRHND